MTIHSSKGLEFPTVFVVGLEENIFPSPRSSSSPRELEEERRLLYVAITRAEKHCFLTCARQRMRFGKPEFNPESRFLHDIDTRLLQIRQETFDGGSSMKRPTHRWQDDIPDYGHYGRTFVKQVKPTPVRPSRVTPTPTTSHGGITTPKPSSATPSGPLPVLKVGDKVEHFRFGVGVVLKVEGSGENTKTTVEFSMAGTKQLLLKFARLKVIQ